MAKTFRCPSCARLNKVRPDKLASSPKCGHCKTDLNTTGAPMYVSDQELTRLLKSSPVPVLVDFYADWCGPCRSLGPHLDNLGRNHAGELMVVKVDTQQDQQHAGMLGVQGIPALFLYKNGRVVDKATGMAPLAFWERMVAPHL